MNQRIPDIPAYNDSAREVLMPAMDQDALAEIQGHEAAGYCAKPRYMELLMEQHYVHHILRMPAEQWPDPRQGPSELGAGGKLVNRDRTKDLARIKVSTLVMAAR